MMAFVLQMMQGNEQEGSSCKLTHRESTASPSSVLKQVCFYHKHSCAVLLSLPALPLLVPPCICDHFCMAQHAQYTGHSLFMMLVSHVM